MSLVTVSPDIDLIPAVSVDVGTSSYVPAVTVSVGNIAGVPSGVGISSGGDSGDVYRKLSNADYDAGWDPILSGADRISIVDALPVPEVTGVLYLVKT